MNEEKVKIQYVIQLVSHKCGKRSEPFTVTQSTLAELLMDKGVDRSDYVLVLYSIDENQIDQRQILFANNPLITVESYLVASGKIQPQIEKEES